MKTLETEILIVGGGLAGRNAAMELREIAPDLRFLLLDAGGAASTEIMGFSAPVHPADSPELFLRDILVSGGGLSDPQLARTLAERALPELKRLEHYGICFDKTTDGAFDPVNALGSTCPRVVHSGTTTGKQAMRLLKTDAIKQRIVRLLTTDGIISGALAADGTLISTKAVILAGGGFAGLWKFNTWSRNLRGDCLILAADAGAELTGLGCVQFEPTVTVFPEENAGFPVITTLLHEGACLRNRKGQSLLSPEEALPRKSELAKLILREINAGNALPHGGILYDFSGVEEKNFSRKYPEYDAKFRRIQPDFRQLSFEVKPGAHTTLGGIRVNDRCETGIPGLFAAGESVGGIHGRDRIGGNAGLEVFVFGRIAGKSAADYVRNAKRALPPNDGFHVSTTPEKFLREVAAILDASFDPLKEPDKLRKGIARLESLPRFPHVRLAIAAANDALNHPE